MSTMNNEADVVPHDVNVEDIDDNIPEEDEDLTVSDENSHAFSPPARITARFSKPSLQRRISSAASSRRNSLTSTSHSVQSNSSYARARRNNHVAQYLRRASILQSRKDQLAARAAHAEQVRLRAALAKSAPRSSNSEERAAAAEQARIERLAKVAATCAEEVRRAKKVAEENKVRKAAEEEKARMEMLERHAEAERRRLEMKRGVRRIRTASSPVASDHKKVEATVEPSMEPEVAAQYIQAAWRIHRKRLILERYLKLGLTVDTVHEMEFDKIRNLLNEDAVLKVTKDVLLLIMQVPMEDGSPACNQMPVRTFLSAYMILGHPQTVLSQDGDLEQTLINKAKELMISFEAALGRCTAENQYTPSSNVRGTLQLAYETFCTAFSDWKSQDSSLLVEMMVASFVSLESIWQNVKDDTDGGVAEDYRDGIRTNQIQLLARIQKLVGRDRGKNMVGAALKDGRQRQRRKMVGNLRPIIAESLMPATPSNGAEALSVAAEVASHNAEQTADTPGAEMAALNRVFSVLPSNNRIIAHELALDKDYRVDVSPHSQLQDAVNRHVCEQMRAAFQQGDGGAWTVAMAENIRHKLLHLVKHPSTTHPLHPVISEALDSELIQRQVVQGVFSYSKFFSFMAILLPKLCAPFRDPDVKALVDELRQDGTTDELIERLFKLLRVIDLLCLDYSNFSLQRAAPLLIREAAGYENRMFALDLETNRHGLERLKRWWNNATIALFTEASADRQADPRVRPSLQKIYNRGLVDLMISASPLRDSEVPETLQLDAERIRDVREQSVRIAIIGATLMTAKNLLKRDVRQQWKSEATRLWDTLRPVNLTQTTSEEEIASLSSRLLSILESSRPMPSTSKQHLQGTITRLLTQASAGRFTDAVAKILLQRLRTHVFRRLAADGSEERVRVAANAGEGLSSSGLPEFVQRIGDLVALLGRVGDVDRRAHGVWYEGVAKVFEEEEGARIGAGDSAGGSNLDGDGVAAVADPTAARRPADDR